MEMPRHACQHGDTCNSHAKEMSFMVILKTIDNPLIPMTTARYTQMTRCCDRMPHRSFLHLNPHIFPSCTPTVQPFMMSSLHRTLPYLQHRCSTQQPSPYNARYLHPRIHWRRRSRRTRRPRSTHIPSDNANLLFVHA